MLNSTGTQCIQLGITTFLTIIIQNTLKAVDHSLSRQAAPQACEMLTKIVTSGAHQGEVKYCSP